MMVPSERISQPLDLNTGHNEVVKGHLPCFLIILHKQVLQTKGLKSINMTSKALPEQRWGWTYIPSVWVLGWILPPQWIHSGPCQLPQTFPSTGWCRKTELQTHGCWWCPTCPCRTCWSSSCMPPRWSGSNSHWPEPFAIPLHQSVHSCPGPQLGTTEQFEGPPWNGKNHYQDNIFLSMFIVSLCYCLEMCPDRTY